MQLKTSLLSFLIGIWRNAKNRPLRLDVGCVYGLSVEFAEFVEKSMMLLPDKTIILGAANTLAIGGYDIHLSVESSYRIIEYPGT